MRHRLIDLLQDLLRSLGSRRDQRSSGRRPSGSPSTSSTSARRPPGQPGPAGPRPSATDIVAGGVEVAYRPELDGEPDPGEVVWTWVPYEDDPRQGKDRPVLIVGHRDRHLVGVALTSKRHDHEPQAPVGTGSWDREGRPSYAKLERLLAVDAHQVRREGAILDRRRFDEVVAALERVHGPLGG